MATTKRGAPRKRGTEKIHTTQRLERGDKAFLEAKAKAAAISVPDLIHSLVESMKVPGTPAEQVLALSSNLVFLQNEMERLARELGRTQGKLQEAQEKNFYLSQRARAMQGALSSLPATVLAKLPDRFLAKNKAIIEAHSVPEADRVVVV